MDNFAAMRMLVRVTDAGSFSAAARQLDVAPSSVSRLIAELGDDLGTPLFQRITRKLSLTEAGQTYYEHANKILPDVDEARLAVSQSCAPSGILRVTSPTAIGRELLISVILDFLKEYPGVRVVMTLNDYVLDLVESSVDVAIHRDRLVDSSLKARKLGDSRRIVCASPEYLKQHGTPKHPKELEGFNCITFRDHPGYNTWSFRGPEGLIKVRASGNFFARSSDGVLAVALAGMGLILMPDWNMGIELNKKELRVVLKDYELSPSHTSFWAVHAHQRQIPPKVRAFINFLIERLGDKKFS